MEREFLRLKTKIDLLKAAFDEAKHPRDQRGRWATVAGGGSSTSTATAAAVPKATATSTHVAEAKNSSLATNVLKALGLGVGALGAAYVGRGVYRIHHQLGREAAEITRIANRTAKQMQFDPKLIEVYRTAWPYHVPALRSYIWPQAYAEIASGKILMYNLPIRSAISFQRRARIGGIVAHEIMHQKFLRYQISGKELIPGMYNRANWTFSPKLLQMAKDDGVSRYSELYWEKGAHPWVSTHETLAEMARLHHETGKVPKVSKDWLDLYNDVNGHWMKEAGRQAFPKPVPVPQYLRDL